MTTTTAGAAAAAPRTTTREAAGGLGIAYALTFGLVLLLVLIPIGALIYGSFRTAAPGQGGDWTVANWIGLGSPGVVDTLVTTIVIAAISSAFCMVIGTAIALVVHRTDFAWKSTVTALVGLSFYFPSFILAMAWIIIGSPGGVINGVLEDLLGLEGWSVDIYSEAGIIFVIVLHQVPFVYLAMRGPIIGMDASYEEAARAAGAKPWAVLRRVTLPLLGYSLASGAVLTFIIALEQFAIPAMIGIPGRVTVLATQLYLLVRFPPVDYGLAASIGLALSGITGIAIWLQRRLARGRRLVVTTGKAGRVAPLKLGRWTWAAHVLCFGYLLLALGLPGVILIYTSVLKFFTFNPFEGAYTLRNYVYIYTSPATIRSIWNTLIVSGLGAALGVLLAAFTSYFTLRLQPKGYRALDFAATLPFGVPGIVLGLGLLWAYAYLPLPLYGTLAIIIIAFITRFLPYATETIGGRFVQIDRSLEEAAWTAGASRMRGIRRILLPLAFPSLQGAYFLLFMAFFREISSAILLFTASTSVLSISIWSFFEQANWGLASAISVLATLIIFLVMSLILWLMPEARRQ